MPESKTIIYPVWRDERNHLFSVDDITGAVAMWAIRQSPYTCPSHLQQAVKDLAQLLPEKTSFGEKPLAYAELSYREIRELLLICFDEIEIIKGWNEPKSGHNQPFVAVSRYWDVPPDDDFIDLDALARNTSLTLIKERLIEED